MANTDIKQLPDELLLEVFRCLSFSDVISCAQVCQRWLGITRSSRLWRNIQYRGRGDNRLKEAFEITKLARGFHSLSLELSHSTCVTISAGEVSLSLSPLSWVAFKLTLVEALEQLSPHLTELTVSGVTMLEHQLQLVKRVLLTVPFPHLQSLRVLSPCGAAVDDTVLNALCDHCPLLELLALEGCDAQRLTAGRGLAQLHRFRNLRKLRLDRKLSSKDVSQMDACLNARHYISAAAIRCTCNGHDISFLKRCYKLTSLHLSPCSEFVYNLPELRSLVLKCDHIQGEHDRLDDTIAALPKLEKLCLIGQWWVDDDDLDRIRAAAPVFFYYQTQLSSTGHVRVGFNFKR